MIAASDLHTYQFRFLTVTSAGLADLLGAASANCVGVLQNKPTAGQSCSIMAVGISVVVSGAAVNPGPVASDSVGRAVAAGSDPTLGWALEAAAAANIQIPVLLR